MRLSIYCSRLDWRKAEGIQRHLKKGGHSTIINGHTDSIARADAVLVVLSPVTLSDDYVQVAVQAAQIYGVEIIPLLVVGDTVPALFDSMGVVDLRRGTFEPLRKRLALLYGDSGQNRPMPRIPQEIWVLLIGVMVLGTLLGLVVFSQVNVATIPSF